MREEEEEGGVKVRRLLAVRSEEGAGRGCVCMHGGYVLLLPLLLRSF